MSSNPSESDVVVVANALRAALAEGDRRFAADSFDARLLNAIVAENAHRARSWVESRVQDGERKSASLRVVETETAESDRIGKLVGSAEAAAMSAVRGRLLDGSWPYWVGAATALLLGLLGLAYDGGISSGLLLAALLASPVVLWLLARNPGTLLRTANSLKDGAESAGRDVVRTWKDVGDLGSAAVGAYEREAGPALTTLFGQLGVAVPPTAIVGKVRRYTRGLLALAWIVLALLIFFAMWGVADGFVAGSDSRSSG